MNITIIGAGNMGGAIALGIAQGTKVKAENITVTARTDETLKSIKSQNAGINTIKSNIEAVKGASLIFLAVKPWQLVEVINEIKDYIDYSKCAVASVVAGVSFADMAEMFDKGVGISPVMYRVIPNTAVSISKSVTFISQHGASETQCAFIKELFDNLGIAMFVDEQQIVAGTSLASCGIAFAFKYLDASIKAGVSDGFSEQQARDIVIQTMSGALELLKSNDSMPQTEIDRVTTPGGLTLRGLEAMTQAGFETSIFAAIKKSRG